MRPARRNMASNPTASRRDNAPERPGEHAEHTEHAEHAHEWHTDPR